MNLKRASLIIALLFVFSFGWNALVHMIILKNLTASVMAIRRPDMGGLLWLSLVATLGIAALFTTSYSKWRRTGTVRETFLHSVYFGILTGVLVDLNQYVLYPLPWIAPFAWFAFGLLEFVCYGLIARTLWPKGEST